MRPYFLPKTAGNGLIYNTFEKSTASDLAESQVNCPPFVRQYVILLTSGVIYYAKRSSKQTVYARVQEKGHRNYAAGKIKLQRNSP